MVASIRITKKHTIAVTGDTLTQCVEVLRDYVGMRSPIGWIDITSLLCLPVICNLDASAPLFWPSVLHGSLMLAHETSELAVPAAKTRSRTALKAHVHHLGRDPVNPLRRPNRPHEFVEIIAPSRLCNLS